MTQLHLPPDKAVVPIQTDTQKRFSELKNENADTSAFDYMNITVKTAGGNTSPLPVALEWETDEDISRLEISLSPEFEEAKIIETDKNIYLLTNLFSGATYYWRVNGSGIRSFSTEAMAPRWIYADNASDNIRDMGAWKTVDGKTVRQGVIYRGGQVDGHITMSDEASDIFLNELGIKTDIDLRGELAGRISESAFGKNVKFEFVPCCAYKDFLKYTDTLVKIFTLLSDENNYPIYFHCVGGADRTGTVAFMLNGFLGVAYDDLLLDYELTSLGIWGDRTAKGVQFVDFLNAIDELSEGESVYSEKIRTVLLKSGVPQDVLDRLKKNLLI